MKKKISIVTPCFNEAENVVPLIDKISEVMRHYEQEYDYEHLFIDNSSTDNTVDLIRIAANQDRHVKAIVNARNFGHIRSPVYGLFQSCGDAVILMASDFQDPPELIHVFIKKWEEGFLVVQAVKTESEESPTMFAIRKAYYWLVSRLSDVQLTKNTTGFGLYDRKVVQILISLKDPYPYLRGLISDLGLPTAKAFFKQPLRRRGITKNNFYTLYDMAMLGITNHSKVPLRLVTMTGFVMSVVCLLVALGYLGAKLMFWDRFAAGMAPALIGIFLMTSLQMFFLGLLGEYIGSIQTHVMNRPLVIEKERIGFGP